MIFISISFIFTYRHPGVDRIWNNRKQVLLLDWFMFDAVFFWGGEHTLYRGEWDVDI